MRVATRLRLFLYLIALLVGRVLMAQEKPDFSGKWVLEQPSPRPMNVAEELDVRQWTEVSGQWYAFDHITIEQRFAGDEVHTNRYQIGLSGGVVSGVDANGRGRGPNGQLSHTRFSTRWEGSRLGIDTGIYSGNSPEAGPYSEISEMWSLDADRLVIVKTTRSSTSEPTTITLIYERRQSPPAYPGDIAESATDGDVLKATQISQIAQIRRSAPGRRPRSGRHGRIGLARK